MEFDQFSPYFTAATIILFSLVAGFVLENLVTGYFRRLALKTGWEGDELLARSLKMTLVYLTAATGVFFATFSLDLRSDILTLIRKVIAVVIVIIAVSAAARIASGLADIYTVGVLPTASLIHVIIQVFVYAIGLLIILQIIGASIAPLLTTLGVGGIAIALALQDTLSNLFAGVQIIAAKQIKTGDYIRLESGQEGYVTDINWRYTTVNALQNNRVIVPNAKLAASIIVNFNSPEREMAVMIPVSVKRDADLEKVEEISITVAGETLKSMGKKAGGAEPVLRFHAFTDTKIDFTVVMTVDNSVDQYLLKHEFIKDLRLRFDKEGL